MRKLRLILIFCVFSLAWAAAAATVVPDRAPAGARVIVTGSGLTGATVTVATRKGDMPPRVVARSATLLELVLPADAVTGHIRITSGGATERILLTVIPQPSIAKSATLAAASPNHDLFKEPEGPFVALPTGIVYIADRAHHQIRAVFPDGRVQLSAGTGKKGFVDGRAATAQFRDPRAVAIDAARNRLYIADSGNHVIRVLTLDGMVSTFAGNGRADDRDGNAQQAGFREPSGLAIDADGNVYVADSGNHKVRRITPQGVVTTFAGTGLPGHANGAATQAQFHRPQGIAISEDGALYIADTANHVIRHIVNGAVTTIAGTGYAGAVDGAAANATFHQPVGLALDPAGDLLIADSHNHKVRRLSATGVVTTLPANISYAQPSGIAVEGAIYIADTKNDAVRILYPALSVTDVHPRSGDPNGGELLRIFGAGFVPGQTTVSIGGISVGATYLSSTMLQVQTPAGAVGAAEIIVTTPAGNARLDGVFQYIPPFTSLVLTPAAATIDPGGMQQFTATGNTHGGSTSDLSSVVTWTTSDASVATVNAAGVAQGHAIGSTTIRAVYGSLSATATLTVRDPNPPIPIPPDPSTVAPPFDAGTSPSFGQAVAFLYSGLNPIQQGVLPGTIDEMRAGVVRGRVLDRAGNPMPAVRVSIADHPELGFTVSRLDGRYDLVVNGGGTLTLRFERAAHLTAERQVRVPWLDYTVVGDVILIGLDSKITPIASNAPALQAARGSVVTDSDGARQATLMFAAGTSATMILPDGTQQSLSSIAVRATEYTVGDQGPKAMPAALPPQSGYTYCVELSVDEALAANAKTVQFSTPVSFYIENFLGFATGTRVPQATYDRERHVWMPARDGRVIRIVRIESGAARVDTNGDDVVDDSGIDLAERQQLAALYAEGTSLWRVQLTHFTPLDLNWSIKLPDDAQLPAGNPTYFTPQSCPSVTSGSIIECENQTLGEAFTVTGTGLGLHYNSDRVRGRLAARALDVPASGVTIPASLQRIEVEVTIAGQTMIQSFDALPNRALRFVWNGLDAYGRRVPAGAPVYVRTSYVYDGVYELPPSGDATFALPSGVRSGVVAREPVIATQSWQGVLGSWTADALGREGWTLTPHHYYDVTTRTLYRGDGSRKSDVPQQLSTPKGVFETVAGKKDVFDGQWLGAGGAAKDAALGEINGTAVAPDGTIYLSEFNFIHKITPDGQLVRVAGKWPPLKPSVNVPPQPAAGAQLWGVRGISVAPDGTIYFAEPNLHVVRKIDRDGVLTRFAGTGGGAPGPNGVSALGSSLAFPIDVVAAPDGSVYIAEADAFRVRRVGPDGIIYTVAGTGVSGFAGDGGPATNARLSDIGSIALGPDGSLYIAGAYRIRRVAPDGIITTIAGTGMYGSSGDGGPATAAAIGVTGTDSSFLTVTSDGSIYFAEAAVIRRIDPSGVINTVAGTGNETTVPDGTKATAGDIAEITTVTSAPDGTIWFQERFAYLLRRIVPAMPVFSGTGQELIVSDGSVVHVFTSEGRHLRTLDAETGGELLRFDYMNGVLSSIIDPEGNTTTIQRNAAGAAVALVAPGGQRTDLAGASQLESMTTAPGETTWFEYTTDGLMKSVTDPRGEKTTFTWSALGMLERDADPEGGAKTLTRTETANGHRVTITTELGRATTYTAEESAAADATRMVVDASNLQTTVSATKTGTTTTTSSSGITTTSTEAPDPIWGMQSPFMRTTTVQWPSGRTLTTTMEREVTLAVPGDPLSLSTRTERVTINGKTTLRVFDRSSLTETITTPEGHAFRRSVDGANRTRRIAAPGLLPIDVAYDVHGRLESIAQGSRRQMFGYNGRHELTSVTDALSRTTRFEYDPAGRVKKQILPDLREIAFGYDLSGNLTSIAPPGRPAHTFRYTGVSLTTAYVPPLLAGTGGTEYIYNVDRDLETIVRPDGTSIDFDYDDGGRLHAITAPDTARGYGYDAGGNLSAITGADADLAYVYDGTAPLQMSWSGAMIGRVSWDYDSDARVRSETAGASAITFTYDDDGDLQAAGALQFFRNASGILDYIRIGTSTETFTFDDHGDLDRVLHQNGAQALLALDYTRDDAGRITGIVESANGTDVEIGYHYDPSGRLDEVTYPDAIVRYRYDSNGNRTAREVVRSTGTSTETASYDAQDRLLNYEGTQYTYTPNGDLLTKTDATGTTHYIYDALGNLRKVTLPNGVVIEYLIDGQNRRVGRKVDGIVTHRWLYADQLRIVAELDATGAVAKRFVYGTRANVPDYMVAGGVTYRIYADHLGSPRRVVNLTTGAVIQSLRFDEYGYVLADTNPGFIPFGFAGGLHDTATGLVRFGARDYDPRVGRWTSKDPILFDASGTNVYEYALGDSVNLFDPTGLDAVTADPHNLEKFLDLYERGGSGFKETERSAFITQSGDNRNCELWPWTAGYRTETYKGQRPPGTIAVAHTHPNSADPQPSDGDRRNANKVNLPFYTVTRKGIYKYDPATGQTTREEDASWVKRAKKTRTGHKQHSTSPCSCSQLE